MSEIIDLTKNSIGNCKFMQHAIFLNKFVRTALTDLLVMSIIVSNCQHCDEQQFQTLACVSYTYGVQDQLQLRKLT